MLAGAGDVIIGREESVSNLPLPQFH
jgi:hypothetical protein